MVIINSCWPLSGYTNAPAARNKGFRYPISKCLIQLLSVHLPSTHLQPVWRISFSTIFTMKIGKNWGMTCNVRRTTCLIHTCSKPATLDTEGLDLEIECVERKARCHKQSLLCTAHVGVAQRTAQVVQTVVTHGKVSWVEKVNFIQLQKVKGENKKKTKTKCMLFIRGTYHCLTNLQAVLPHSDGTCWLWSSVDQRKSWAVL